jgi:hypothetical protein
MTELVTIPISIFDVIIEYAKPNLRLALTRTDIVEELFEKFGRWNITVDDLEVISEGKPSEQGVKFKIPKRKTAFFFSAAQARLSWDDANWETAEETVEILAIGLEALARHGKVLPAKFKTAVALHLQPKTLPFVDLLKPFAHPAFAKLQDSPITAFATVLRWDGRRITVDGSAQLANAVFLKFEREFPGGIELPDMAKQIYADEQTLFSILGVEEVRP